MVDIYRAAKWRIDEAWKQRLTSPGHIIDPPVWQRCRLYPVKVDYFLDFTSSPSFLQNVAYGTKTLKLSDGGTIEIRNYVEDSGSIPTYFQFVPVILY